MPLGSFEAFHVRETCPDDGFAARLDGAGGGVTSPVAERRMNEPTDGTPFPFRMNSM